MKQSGWVLGLSRTARVAALIVAAALAGCSAGNIDAVELEPSALFEGLVAHWTFDDAGTTLTDSTINHHDGMIEGATTWLPGEHFGGALRFMGGQVVVPIFTHPTASWSVAGWIRAPNVSTGDLYATVVSTEIPVTPTGPTAGGWELNMRVATPGDPTKATSLYQYAYPDQGGYSFAECDCFVSDEWEHIAGVFDADAQTISIYHNGSFAVGKASMPNILPGTDMLYIGGWSLDATRRLLGDLDDFVIYNRALTQSEIQQLARAPLPATPPP